MKASQEHWEKMGVGDWIGVQQAEGFRDHKACSTGLHVVALSWTVGSRYGFRMVLPWAGCRDHLSSPAAEEEG